MLLGPVAWWATPSKHLQGKDKTDALNGTRQVLLAAAGGAAALTGLLFTGRTFHLSRRGQLTDRYSKATAQLASDKQTERLAGVYALEHVMVESVRDHDAVVEMLSAFIRERRPLSEVAVDAGSSGENDIDAEAQATGTAPETPSKTRKVPADVQAALTVLGRRPRRPERNGVDLRNTDLTGADFSKAHFPNLSVESSLLCDANLTEADLTALVANNANLRAAKLDGARLQKAQLREVIGHGASLVGAQLSAADFRYSGFKEISAEGANFRGAIMDYAVFDDSDFARCDMREASLVGAKLRGVNLSRGRLSDAKMAKAQIQRSNFLGANLKGVDLDRTGMEGALFYSALPEEGVAQNLTGSQVVRGFRDQSTVLPPELKDLPPGLQRMKNAIQFGDQQD
ncbi:hypothetical protein GCM10010172_43370 [Paractinoplanes ferrugineus]|uniref:Pentapeptide repeat-containing protein n=1 Tax=Paractinoplanes ferrugineus TaxID=113564 RepID=A0A919J2U2_9ACTN|nr:hypothetical protein Afe05nite_53350 [Actinoplanes ferrugineus]